MFLGIKEHPARRADNPTAICGWCLDSLWYLTYHNPIGLHRLLRGYFYFAYLQRHDFFSLEFWIETFFSLEIYSLASRFPLGISSLSRRPFVLSGVPLLLYSSGFHCATCLGVSQVHFSSSTSNTCVAISLLLYVNMSWCLFKYGQLYCITNRATCNLT
jgi:hypothetical protein